MKKIVSLVAVATLSMTSASAFAANDCLDVPTHDELQAALDIATDADLGGLNFDMWGVVVNRNGVVCAVAKSFSDENLVGGSTGSTHPWLGSRAIAAQKANTAVAYSTDFLALSTANLYSAVQPGGSLYGLQHSNPVDPRVAFRGKPSNYGTASDPMIGFKVGGVNVFGGGLPLYNDAGVLVGAIGVSGDTSCADHNVGFAARENLNSGEFTVSNLDNGVGYGGLKGWGMNDSDDNIIVGDNIIYDIVEADNGVKTSPSGFGHPLCNVNFSQDEEVVSNSYNEQGNGTIVDGFPTEPTGYDLQIGSFSRLVKNDGTLPPS